MNKITADVTLRLRRRGSTPVCVIAHWKPVSDEQITADGPASLEGLSKMQKANRLKAHDVGRSETQQGVQALKTVKGRYNSQDCNGRYRVTLLVKMARQGVDHEHGRTKRINRLMHSTRTSAPLIGSPFSLTNPQETLARPP